MFGYPRFVWLGTVEPWGEFRLLTKGNSIRFNGIPFHE
jgi:hypothetical protein